MTLTPGCDPVASGTQDFTQQPARLDVIGVVAQGLPAFVLLVAPQSVPVAEQSQLEVAFGVVLLEP